MVSCDSRFWFSFYSRDRLSNKKMDKEKKQLEKDIMREICQYMEDKGLFFWRSNNIPVFGMNNGGKMTFRSLPKHTPRGLPDIMCIYKGTFIAIEVKRPGAKMRPDQLFYGDKCVLNGGIYRVFYSLLQAQVYFESIDITPKNIWKNQSTTDQNILFLFFIYLK